MGRRPSPHGYAASRYNRMTHGVMIHDLLPSRGLEHCPLSDGCPCWDDDMRHLCVPGQPCRWESWFHHRYVTSGRREHQRCLLWLTEEERDRILHELAILSLRRRRLSALIGKEGLLRPKVHPVSGYVYGQKEGLGVGRYATAISRQFHPLFDQLVLSPEEREERDREEAARDEPVTPGMLRYEPPPPPEPEPEPEPFVNPTADWFTFKKPWDHEPGKPHDEQA